MKKYLTAAICAGLLSCASANATLVDFVAEAAGNERGVADGTTINFGGLDVTFSSLTDDLFFAYFDDVSNGPGGLGACKELISGPGSACLDPSDDNIREGDAVTVTFGETVNLSNLSFSDKDHQSLNFNDTNSLLIAINDPMAFASYTFAEATMLVIAGVDLIRFSFDNSGSGREFYVNSFEASTVPIPAALPLFISALFGLGFASRRGRKST
jgi:hypothetical protein